MFFSQKRHKFINEDGSFNNAPFVELLNKSKKAALRKNPKIIIKKAPVVIVLWGISPKEIWQFINKLSNFLNSGIDLKTAFSIVHKQVKNPKLQGVVGDIRANLDHGLSISDTLRQHSKYFDPFIIALVEVGEKTGTLPRVITELEATLLENMEIKGENSRRNDLPCHPIIPFDVYGHLHADLYFTKNYSIFCKIWGWCAWINPIHDESFGFPH